jgi:hypothetical protein
MFLVKQDFVLFLSKVSDEVRVMKIPKQFDNILKEAVAFFWSTRNRQSEQQVVSGRADQGYRSAVTGGKQMDGIVELLRNLIEMNGIHGTEVYTNKALELPGFFRPTKQWDLLVVANNTLVAVIELKSQIGPSFGNNFNNRTEEAMGSSLDIWTAYEKGAFGNSSQPWLGYLMLLEDCAKSRSTVGVLEPHFKVFDEFREASYAKRYELFCRKLVMERHYSSACFLMSSKESGQNGVYFEPASDLEIKGFIYSLLGHICSFSASRAK